MTRFSLGGDEDGEGEGSRSPRHKKPRVLPFPPPPRPRPAVHLRCSSSSIAIVEPQQPQPQPQPQPLPTGVEEEEEEDEEEESESDVEEYAEYEDEEEEEEEVESGESEEESEEAETEEEQQREDEIIILAEQPVNWVTPPSSGSAFLLPVRPNRTAQATNPQVGSASTSLTTTPNSAAAVQVGPRSISPLTDGSIVFTLSDPDVLDCLICYEPLTIPVFQCENGHIACSSCCTKTKNKCPSCSWPIGYNRCRAIEKVLESIRVSCQHIKHGCKELLTYNKKNEHEKTCMYTPCSCPFLLCSFVSSSKQLYQHFSSVHVNSATRFVYSRNFSMAVHIGEKYHILQEENDGILFILDNKHEILGNLVSISCIQPSFRGGFYYDLLAKTKGSSLKFQSFTKSNPGRVHSPSTGYFIVPSDFFDSGYLQMDLCIWRNGYRPASLQILDVA